MMHNINNCCFDAVFDILKLEDLSTIHFQVRFFRPDILGCQGLYAVKHSWVKVW